MKVPLTGWVHGHTITLDAPVPPLEGCVVRVRLEPVGSEEDMRLAPDVQAALWKEWKRRGPQVPIEDEEEQDFP